MTKDNQTSASPVALITGGSSGLGSAMAKLLSQQGYEIILIARNKKKLDQAVNAIQKISATTVVGISCDVSDEESLKNVAVYLQQKNKKINLLILSAGVLYVNALKDSDTKQLKEVIDVDLWGAILSTKIFLPYLANKAHILFI